MVGDYDMPFVYAQDIELDDISLIGFNNIKSFEREASKNKTVHFFLDDYKFDEVWKNPEQELTRLSQYAQLLSPDFSVYADMPTPLQIYSVFKNRWCASFWQFNKMAVIPTVSWGGGAKTAISSVLTALRVAASWLFLRLVPAAARGSSCLGSNGCVR